VFYPVNTFLNRKAKSGVRKVVETELDIKKARVGLIVYMLMLLYPRAWVGEWRLLDDCVIQYNGYQYWYSYFPSAQKQTGHMGLVI